MEYKFTNVFYWNVTKYINRMRFRCLLRKNVRSIFTCYEPEVCRTPTGCWSATFLRSSSIRHLSIRTMLVGVYLLNRNRVGHINHLSSNNSKYHHRTTMARPADELQFVPV